MSLFTPKSTAGADLESRGVRLSDAARRSGSLRGQDNAGWLRRQAVQADNDKNRAVARADAKARNGG